MVPTTAGSSLSCISVQSFCPSALPTSIRSPSASPTRVPTVTGELAATMPWRIVAGATPKAASLCMARTRSGRGTPAATPPSMMRNGANAAPLANVVPLKWPLMPLAQAKPLGSVSPAPAERISRSSMNRPTAALISASLPTVAVRLRAS